MTCDSSRNSTRPLDRHRYQGTLTCLIDDTQVSTPSRPSLHPWSQLIKFIPQIRDFAIGLNCGIWDYSASIINKFGKRKNFVIPDRKKYVNMEREFLKNYMKKVVKVCHDHGALATGGMAAQLLSTQVIFVKFQVLSVRMFFAYWATYRAFDDNYLCHG